MSERSRSSGDGLCQPLHCLPASQEGGPLCHCALITFSTKKHGRTLSKLLAVLFSFTATCLTNFVAVLQNFLLLLSHRLPGFCRRVVHDIGLCLCVFVLNGQNSDYTTGQVFDLSEKLEQSEAQLGRGSFMLGLDTHDRKSEDKLAKATRDRSLFLFAYFQKVL